MRLQNLVYSVFVLVRACTLDFGELSGWSEKERVGEVDYLFISIRPDATRSRNGELANSDNILMSYR